MNPYNFVPLGPPAERKEVKLHHKFHGLSGEITCRLETLTHFFTAGEQARGGRKEHQELSLLRDADRPVIPGSSLKGAIRSLAEAISGSCLALPFSRSRGTHNDQLEYYDYKKHSKDRYPLPKGFSPCGMDENADPKNQTACPACRMFGYLHKKILFMGNVSFGSAQLKSDENIETLTLEPFGSPAPRHRPFYGTKESDFRDPRGRKFYYHRVQGARTMKDKTDFNKTVEAITPGAVFEFTVNYENLSKPELALLIYVLVLEEPMRHKIGMGKGVGLGSVKISITGWKQRNVMERYRQWGSGVDNLSGDALNNAIKTQIESYHCHYVSWKDSLTALKDILTWDNKNPRDPRYPSNPWFTKNGSVPLEDVPDDAGDYGRKASGPGGHGPRSPHYSEQESAKKKAEADKMLKRIISQQQKTTLKSQTAYQNGETESKANVHLAADESWQVSLPRLPEERFTLKIKPYYSNAKDGRRIRVRVVVNKNGDIVRAEEL